MHVQKNKVTKYYIIRVNIEQKIIDKSINNNYHSHFVSFSLNSICKQIEGRMVSK